MSIIIPRSVIVQSYCWEFSAADIAAFLRQFYKTRSITAEEIEDIWAQERELNAPMRELGERPPKGFHPSERVALAERLVA